MKVYLKVFYKIILKKLNIYKNCFIKFYFLKKNMKKILIIMILIVTISSCNNKSIKDNNDTITGKIDTMGKKENTISIENEISIPKIKNQPNY
jgi:hypothetical protein